MGANSAGLGPGAHPPRWTRYDRNTSFMLASNSRHPPNLSTPMPMFLRFNILYWASNCRAGKPECRGATSSLPYPVQLFSASCTARTHGCGSLEGPCWLLPRLTQASLPAGCCPSSPRPPLILFLVQGVWFPSSEVFLRLERHAPPAPLPWPPRWYGPLSLI